MEKQKASTARRLKKAVPAAFLIAIANLCLNAVLFQPGLSPYRESIEPGYAAMGFLLLRPQPSAATRIRLEYTGSAEQKYLTALSAAVWLACFTGLFLSRRRVWKP